METLISTAVVVGLAEVGDKSLFLTLLLMARWGRPWPVFWGLIAGVGLNFALAITLGYWLADIFESSWLSWVLGFGFLALAVWSLLEPPPEPVTVPEPRGGIFPTALLGFFLLEMADKTQLAAVGLALSLDGLPAVYVGAVLGVVLVNAPAIWMGQRFAAHLPVVLLHKVAMVIFAMLGIWFLVEAVGWLA